MTTRFITHQITGKGRGKFIGYPTINMAIPDDMDLGFGVYAAWVTLSGVRCRGAMHWGPIPTFDDADSHLEVFLLDLSDHELSHTDMSAIDVEPVKKLRDIIKFPSVNALTQQMEKDVSSVRKTLVE